jgi:hypothetical protein
MFTDASLPVNDCLDSYLPPVQAPTAAFEPATNELEFLPQSVSAPVWNLCFAMVLVATAVVVIASLGGDL